MFQKYGTMKLPFMSIEIVPIMRKIVQNMGISGFINFEIWGLFLCLYVRVNKYNKIQSGMIEKMSFQKIKVLITPEYRIQYNKIKTKNLSRFIKKRMNCFLNIFKNSFAEHFLD